MRNNLKQNTNIDLQVACPTVFKRGLITKGYSTDFGKELEKPQSWIFVSRLKVSIASITLDLKLIDFYTFTGMPMCSQSIISITL